MQKLSDALRTVGGCAAARDKVIALCKSIEQDLAAYDRQRARRHYRADRGRHVQRAVAPFCKTLADGTVFEFLYRTQIARDFS